MLRSWVICYRFSSCLLCQLYERSNQPCWPTRTLSLVYFSACAEVFSTGFTQVRKQDQGDKYRGAEPLALAVEGELFALTYETPAWPPLFALPPTNGHRRPETDSQGKQPFIIFIFFINLTRCGANAPWVPCAPKGTKTTGQLRASKSAQG